MTLWQWQPGEVVAVVALLADAAMTYAALRRGGVEGNPFLARLARVPVAVPVAMVALHFVSRYLAWANFLSGGQMLALWLGFAAAHVGLAAHAYRLLRDR